MTIVKQGTRFLNNIGNFLFKDNKLNMVAFTGTFATSYAIDISMTAQDTRGGAGNALIMRTYSDRSVTATLNITEWNLAFIAASVGSQIAYGLTELFEIEAAVQLAANGIGKLAKTAIGNVSVKFEDGRRIEVTPAADNTIDLGSYDIGGTCVTVTYAFNAEAKSVTITSANAPWIGQLVLQGVISDSRMGKIGNVSVDIPAFALDGNLAISINADGTTSETSMVGTALATDGTTCLDGMVYGYVKEFVEDDLAPQLVGITASPSPIELLENPTPTTQQITVTGQRGVMFTDIGVLPAECTYISDNTSVATVNANGLVTAVAAGDCEIEITHTETGLIDTVDVVVE
jgi:hypothetical protein